MSSTSTRNYSLFVTSDWKRVYETFREADFQSYDYETLRKTMIDYLRIYYPEDFNDFIESSEYIALIDLIAFLGQSLAFRTDLNARENFLETAERRDSVLRIARMLSYYPKRNQTARGFLKIQSITTTENVFDSNGFNLADTPIIWNDNTNSDFLEQFTIVMNAALQSSQRFGKPAYKSEINGIKVEEYQMNLVPDTVPIYSFTTTVNGLSMDFELVNGTFSGQSYVYENPPVPGNAFNMIYRNDGRGNGSVNSGFFIYFKQGTVQQSDFTIDESIENRVVNLNVDNIDNNDIWLYKLDSNGDVVTQWTKVPAVSGTNVIYNDLAVDTRTLYAVNSRTNDQVDLAFGDGVFSDIPVGDFRVIYRTGNALEYKITPEDLQNVVVDIPYLSRYNKLETLTLELSLESTVSNASARENLNSIKAKAPLSYYSQNRMVNGEDYNAFPLTKFNDILKVKSVNRTSSGISRYLDVRDTTGKYSSTNIFADDGLFYEEESSGTFTFEFTNDNDILNVIINQVEPIIDSKASLHYYYKNYTNYDLTVNGVQWLQLTTGTNLATGYFTNSNGDPQTIGSYVTSNLKYLKTNTLVKFVAPTGFYFKEDGSLAAGTSGDPGTSDFIWTAITSVIDDGANQGAGALNDGSGPVSLNEIVPTGAIATEVVVPFTTDLPTALENDIITRVKLFKEFGLRFDQDSQEWIVIEDVDLDKSDTFNLEFTGNTNAAGLDNSWFILFETDGETYTVKYRTLDYFFESTLQTRFYFEPGLKIFDPRTGQTIKDNIRILKVNPQPDSNEAFTTPYNLSIYDNVQEADGYVDSTKVKVTFPDRDDDGVPDNPEVFDIIVAPTINSTQKLAFFGRILDSDNFERWKPISTTTVNVDYTTETQINANLTLYNDGQIFYATTDEKFFVLDINSAGTRSISESTDYRSRVGRDLLNFQYTHNSPNDRRIDPSPANFMDMFLLTRAYDEDYRNYISDTTNTVTEPTKPTSFELRNSFGGLEAFKTVSDTLIFNSVKYKPLFGDKADSSLQASFKVIKNNPTLKTDSEIKVRIVESINEFFAVENWDFGDTFYFSELAGYLHQELVPDIETILIVPKSGDQVFGSLFQITAQRDEIFISAATVNDVEVIDAITANRLKASGNVVTSSTSSDTITSSFSSAVTIVDTNVGSTS